MRGVKLCDGGMGTYVRTVRRAADGMSARDRHNVPYGHPEDQGIVTPRANIRSWALLRLLPGDRFALIPARRDDPDRAIRWTN